MPKSESLVISDKTVQWLLQGDVSIQYQTHRDLLDADKYLLKDLQHRIPSEGWGARFMAERHPNGHWGDGLYRPKWTCTHYTLLDLKNLGFPPGHPSVNESMDLILAAPYGKDGGINYSSSVAYSDVCINGMILNFGSWFLDDDKRLVPIADYLLKEQMEDGGWNCERYQGATHSSLHTTISVLEGLLEWSFQGQSNHLNKVANAIKEGEAFILKHRLFRSHRTGEIIDPKMLRLPYPARWHYDILRALDYFRKAGHVYDERMQDAIEELLHKRRSDGRWPLHAAYPGQVHFQMETAGEASRWNTLRALRILNHFNIEVTP
jgi:hypothetical protein